jgi:hypothetical protein
MICAAVGAFEQAALLRPEHIVAVHDQAAAADGASCGAAVSAVSGTSLLRLVGMLHTL